MKGGSASTAVTLARVAEAAGVSIATASRVLNHSARVNPVAYQKVCEAATRLGYRRQRAPWGQGGRSIRAVAAVVHAGHRRLFTEPFFARFIGAAEAELGRHDIPLLVISASGTLTGTVVRYLQGNHVDGVVVLSDHGPLPLAASLTALGVPMTLIGRPLDPSLMSYVDVDNRGGAGDAVAHLLAQGRRSIAHIAGPPDTGVGTDRLAGYQDAMRAAGIGDAPVAYGDWGQASAAHAMQRLLDQRPKLDAVFAACDVMAAGAMNALHRAGRRVPEDVAVVGFDDHALAQRVRPTLTTVRQPVEELAEVAIQRLLAAAGGQTGVAEPTVLTTQLIIRESA
jgi:DNA-binding LacI/PurR family transcriptional regulator